MWLSFQILLVLWAEEVDTSTYATYLRKKIELINYQHLYYRTVFNLSLHIFDKNSKSKMCLDTLDVLFSFIEQMK